MDEKDLDAKLEEFGQKATPEYLIKLHKVKLAERILKGETGLKKEFDELVELEKKLTAVPPEAAAPASSSAPLSPAPLPGGEGAPPHSTGSEQASGEEEEGGIPEAFRTTKRKYTWSESAQKAREQNAKAPRAGSVGNRRNWKGGLHAQDYIFGRIRPCKSTCPIFDTCELIEKGATQPGGICYDKQAVIETYSALMEAIQEKKFDDFNSVAALTLAETIEAYRRMMEEAAAAGYVVLRKRYDKDGNCIMEEYVPHPNLMAAPKFFADIRINADTLMATPKSVKDDKNAEDANETIGKVLGSVGEMITKSRKKSEDEE